MDSEERPLGESKSDRGLGSEADWASRRGGELVQLHVPRSVSHVVLLFRVKIVQADNVAPHAEAPVRIILGGRR